VVGFSVRKSKDRKIEGTTTVYEKYYVCSAQGKRNIGTKKEECDENYLGSTSSKQTKRRQRRVIITRTGCEASIRAKVNEDGQFKIVSHVLHHNHPLTRQSLNYLHRCQRQMTSPKKQAIEAMTSCGLTPIDSYRYMTTEAGGEDLIGHTKKDHFNCCYKLKMKPLSGKDSQTVVDRLQEQVSSDPEFFFRVRLNEEGKVCCLFWRDSMMLEDYKIYGDVMVFDTTYRTNRYNLICAPFVGINNHWKNTMFACAFIGDERIESFEWVFDTFKTSMQGKEPITIFSDQDAAIAAAIREVCTLYRNQSSVCFSEVTLSLIINSLYTTSIFTMLCGRFSTS